MTNPVAEHIEYDQWGPEYVVKVFKPEIDLVGFLVIDNTTLGPGKGGIRMTSNVTEEEIRRLARAMTWKNALAGIPFGGAKAGIRWEGGSEERKKQLVREFARAIKIFTPGKYIAGPDVNTGEREMQWFVEATGNWRSATGKPANLCMEVFGKKGEKPRKAQGARGKCGIPHEFGSTGFGVAHATKVAADLIGLTIHGATVAIHGFGNVGTFTYKFLTDMGAKVVAIADVRGAVYAKDGFDKKIMEKLIAGRKSVVDYQSGEEIRPEDFWKIPVDILIPASVTDVINETNKNDINARIIVEAANIPMREATEKELRQKGILIVPDFVANAGGVISSYAEYRGYNPKRMFETVKNKVTSSTTLVLEQSLKQKENPRDAALRIAQGIILGEKEHQDIRNKIKHR